MENIDWMGIYKGLRLPFLGIVLILITWYIYRPSRKKNYEDVKYTIFNDEDENQK